MVTLEQIAEKYPTLWHMADPRNTVGILRHGLLSTSALLDLLETPAEERRRYETERRADDVVLHHSKHGRVVLRDQRPLNMSRLAHALTDGAAADFLRAVNERVFFWPTEARLATMNGAKAYADRPQLVLALRTSTLLAAHREGVRLSRINSGATTRFTSPRSAATFQTLEEYNWSDGRKQVAEITVARSVPDIWTHIVRVESWINGARRARLNRPWDETLEERTLRSR